MTIHTFVSWRISLLSKVMVLVVWWSLINGASPSSLILVSSYRPSPRDLFSFHVPVSICLLPPLVCTLYVKSPAASWPRAPPWETAAGGTLRYEKNILITLGAKSALSLLVFGLCWRVLMTLTVWSIRPPDPGCVTAVVCVTGGVSWLMAVGCQRH